MNNPTKKINFVAFSELRPGTPYSDTKEILLRHWRELKNSDEGGISLFKFGCALRVDRDGIIGQVRYFGNFPKKRVIEGLKRGMTLDHIKTLYPNLELHVDAYGDHWYRCALPSGDMLSLFFHEKTLAGITIENPAVVYPDKHDNLIRDIYPAPVVQDPPLFQCPNLKLIVLETLLYDGHIDLGDYDELASFVLNRFIDFDEDEQYNGYDLIPECRDYLYNYPLSPKLLEKVSSLCLDGGNDIYCYIFRYWNGESDDFDVTSFKGVENLPNLKSIDIISMADLNDSEYMYLEQLRLRGIEIDNNMPR